MTDWGGGLKGAGGGALAGAAFGPIGAGIGGLIGGVAGLFGGNDNDAMKQKLQDYYNSIQGSPGAAQSGYSGFRKNQSDLVNRLEAMSNGQGPSLAAQQFQQATDRNVAGQQAMANSGRGGPMAQLTAANNMAGLGAQAAQGSAIARTNEEMGALSQLGGVINQGRGADEQTNMFNAGQQNSKMALDRQSQMKMLELMQGNANQPTLGDQLLAGGAGMYGMKFGQGWGNGMPNAKDAGNFWQGSKTQGSLYGLGTIGNQGGGGGGGGGPYGQWNPQTGFDR